MWIVSNQDNYFENATACSKRTLKTTVATQLKQDLGESVENLLIHVLYDFWGFPTLRHFATYYSSVFQPLLICGTFKTLLGIWRNLGTQNSTNLRITTEPSEE